MMKKILFMVASVALMAMVSCNKENANDAPQVKEPSVIVEFSASISADEESTDVKPQSSAATRTTVDFTTRKTKWEIDDVIFINGKKFEVKELVNGGLSAVFTNVDELEDFSAPYTAIYSGNNKNNTMTIPENQTAVEGVLGVPVCAAAYSENTTLQFKHAASILKFKVPMACSTVTLTSDTPLAGTVSMNKDQTFTSGDKKTLTITGYFTTNKEYYVAVTHGKKTNFTVRIDGYYSKSAASVTVNPKTIADMKTLPAPEQCEWGIVGAHQTPTTWNISSPTPMRKVDESVYAILGITLKADGFKFAHMTKNTWNGWSFGAWKNSPNKGYFDFNSEMSQGAWYGNPLYSNNAANDQKNIGVSDFSKTYDIYLKITAQGDWGIGAKYIVVKSGTKVTYPN